MSLLAEAQHMGMTRRVKSRCRRRSSQVSQALVDMLQLFVVQGDDPRSCWQTFSAASAMPPVDFCRMRLASITASAQS